MKKKYYLPVYLIILSMTILLASCSVRRVNDDAEKPTVSKTEEAKDGATAESEESPETTAENGDGSMDLSAAGFKMVQYQNARFGFSMSYPDIYDSAVESDNGDGITLESSDGRYSLLIWAGNNLEKTDGAGLLKTVKESVADIQDESSDGQRYSITFEGGDQNLVLFVQKGYAGEAASVHFRISFPAEEKDQFADVITRMESELNID